MVTGPADALRYADIMWAGDAASAALGMQLEQVGLGRARVSMVVRSDMVNGWDVCHGGLIASLADSTFALACNSHGTVTVASGFEIDFLEPARLGDELIADAQERVLRGAVRDLRRHRHPRLYGDRRVPRPQPLTQPSDRGELIMTDAVRIERDGAVATVILNRPERRNAMTLELKTALLEALRHLAADQGVRCVVLTGQGKGFCVGQDLAEHAELMQSADASVFSTVAEHYSPIIELLAGMAKPVIAAVNGTCAGAGLGFALACDLRVFAEDATLGTAFSGVGLTCDSGLSATLPRAVGEARARELVLLGRTFTPVEAVGWGITGEVVATADVAETAGRLAAQLAAGPTVAYAESKRLLAAGLDGTLAEALAAESEAQNGCGRTEDHRNAVRSFLAHESPTFTGR